VAQELNLTTEEQSELKNAIEAYARESGRSTFTLGEYMNKWRELAIRVRSGYPLGIYDYTNELSSRDILQEFVECLPRDVKEKVEKAIAEVDEIFKEETSITSVALAGPTESTNTRPWWWNRIPKKLEGELKEDIQSLG
jgi:hypothetical protein